MLDEVLSFSDQVTCEEWREMTNSLDSRMHEVIQPMGRKYWALYTVNHKKGHPFYFGNNLAKCWPNFTIFGRNVAEEICNTFVLCWSPHLYSVITLPQENKVPFNYACTCESVPLTMLMIKTYRLNKTIQIHNAYVSVITCVRSVHLRQIHNSEGWSRDWLKRGLQCHNA